MSDETQKGARDLLPTMLSAALRYAERGLPVLPLHTPHASSCSCGNAACTSIGKHPRTDHGLHDASTNTRTIRAWWDRWPDANLGISTGPPGWVVIDVDAAKGGMDTWQQLIGTHSDIHNTLSVRTGGGGFHLIYKAPQGVTVRSSAGTLGPGIDVRAAGGYIVAPPSLHVSGQRYEWVRHD